MKLKTLLLGKVLSSVLDKGSDTGVKLGTYTCRPFGAVRVEEDALVLTVGPFSKLAIPYSRITSIRRGVDSVTVETGAATHRVQLWWMGSAEQVRKLVQAQMERKAA